MAVDLAYGAAYLGGHPGSPKPVAHCAIGINGGGVTVQRLSKRLIHEPWAYISTLAAEGPIDVQSRFTATRLAALGPLTLAFKKEKNSACFITVEGGFGLFIVEVMKKSVLQLRAELAPWQSALADSRCRVCGYFLGKWGKCAGCGTLRGEAAAAGDGAGLADQLAQLADLYLAGALTTESSPTRNGHS
jgi:hypothetical protein